MVHASRFGSWIMDDAGISFAYARSLAAGHGLVAQAGQPAVEGFSNPLWTWILAAAYALGVFDPVATPKILGSLLVAGAFLMLSSALMARPGASVVALTLALSATAHSTPFAVWSVSGLENPLHVALVAALVSQGLLLADRGRLTRRDPLLLGMVCFLLFLTRPDGALYVLVPPLLFGLYGPAFPRRAVRRFAGAFLVPFAVATVARLAYFQDVLPNTYYAKRGPGWRQTASLLEALGTPLGGAVFLALVTFAVFAGILTSFWVGTKLRARGVVPSPLVVLGLYAAMAYLIFELLPADWMPHFRFATVLFLLLPLVLVEAVRASAQRYLSAGPSRWAPAAAGALLVLAATLHAMEHSRAFAREPTVPLAEVGELSARLDRVGASLGLERPVVLLPDIGGSLWVDRFEVLDLAGLTDRTIGRTLHGDRRLLTRYLLDDAQPDLIWVHGYWQRLMDFEAQEAFRRLYTLCDAEAYLGREDGALYARLPVPPQSLCAPLTG